MIEGHHMDFHDSSAQNMEPRDFTPRWYNPVSSSGQAWNSARSGRFTHRRDCLPSVMRMMASPNPATIAYGKLDIHQSVSQAIPACNASHNLTRKAMTCSYIIQRLVCSMLLPVYKPSKALF